MASSGKKPNKPTFEMKGFVRCELDESMKADLKSRAFTPDWVFDALDKLTDSGYKISVNYDDYNRCTGAFMTDREPKRSSYGYTLSGRGSNTLKALASLLYKHMVVLQGDWNVSVDRNSEGGDEYG